MNRSTIFLPDVNVWLAATSKRHVHTDLCSNWLNSIQSDTVVFCRITQMGLLRLLTNETVMGNEVLSCRAAWELYGTIINDDRSRFVSEPLGLEHEWKGLTDQNRPVTKLWTDAYLIAFARAAGVKLVTIDRGIASRAAEAILLG